MSTLQINLADAIKAYGGADAAGKKLLTNLFPKANFNLSITDRVKTFEDVLAIAGISSDWFENKAESLTPDERAYRQVKLITEVLNEGWTPDWNNGNQSKYYPYFDMQGAFSYHVFVNYCQLSFVGSRLCFKTAALAKYAGTQFLTIYKTLYTA